MKILNNSTEQTYLLYPGYKHIVDENLKRLILSQSQ